MWEGVGRSYFPILASVVSTFGENDTAKRINDVHFANIGLRAISAICKNTFIRSTPTYGGTPLIVFQSYRPPIVQSILWVAPLLQMDTISHYNFKPLKSITRYNHFRQTLIQTSKFGPNSFLLQPRALQKYAHESNSVYVLELQEFELIIGWDYDTSLYPRQ